MAKGRPLEPPAELLEAFQRSGEVNAFLVGIVPDHIWREEPPGGGRTIAAIVAHMQSMRRTFARMAGARPGPASIDARRTTRDEAQAALRQSTDVLAALFEDAFREGRARVKGTPRRVVDTIAYLLQHDAHHRGQICMIARMLGHQFTGRDMTWMWGWRKNA